MRDIGDDEIEMLELKVSKLEKRISNLERDYDKLFTKFCAEIRKTNKNPFYFYSETKPLHD